MALRLASVVFLAVPALAQVAIWGQCGGMHYTGSTTCQAGLTCVYFNDWYSQCQQGTPQPTSTTSPRTSSTPTSVTSSTSVPTNPGTCSTPSTNPTSTTVQRLNDPFEFAAGGRVTSKADWTCRAEEISWLFQQDELGDKPPKPQSVTGSLSGNTLTINVSDQGKSISFSVSISYPSGNGPFPAIIAYAFPSIPIPNNVATITFNNDDIAVQQNSGSRGQGKFYTLYGSNHSAGAMMAWAWGVSRIIDALESIPNSRINTQRIGVTGCSRNGKGAYIAGAFDDRIALTIPQESGSGGAACWRLSDAQKSSGQNVQTASQIITENVWFSTRFNPFVNQVTRLPFDHHMLAGLVAPRGLLIIENTSQEWLGNMSCYGCQVAGRAIYEALGVPDNMGVSQIGNHNHCSFPSSQNPEMTAFINKFLLDQSSNTDVVRTDGNFNFDRNTWMPWSIPILS